MPGKSRTYEPKVLIPTNPISGAAGKELGTPSAEEATRSLMAEDKKRKEEAGLSLTEKRLLKKARERQESRNTNRAVWDVGKELKDLIAEFAASQGTTATQVAAWILWPEIKKLVESNGKELSSYKMDSKTIHHDYNLDLERRKKE